MRTHATLARVANELKANHEVTLKLLAEMTGIQYNYLTRMVSGQQKFSNAAYDKIMNVARNKGIDTTVYTTRSTTPELPVTMNVVNQYPDAGNMTITLKLQLKNNKITAVEWDTTPLL